MSTSALAGVSSATSSSSAPSPSVAKKMDLQPQDFIKMMITQLQNQDPMEPAKNEQLLSQMSQIGQLQSSTQLQESLSKMVLQNNLGSAGNLIGKTVNGLSDTGDDVVGTVASVRVEGNDVKLELDNGQSVRLDRVTEITADGTGSSSF